MNQSRSSLIVGAIIFVLLLPLFFILLSAFFAFLFVFFWIFVLSYLWMNNPKFQLAVKILAVVGLASLILVAVLRDSNQNQDQALSTLSMDSNKITLVN